MRPMESARHDARASLVLSILVRDGILRFDVVACRETLEFVSSLTLAIRSDSSQNVATEGARQLRDCRRCVDSKAARVPPRWECECSCGGRKSGGNSVLISGHRGFQMNSVLLKLMLGVGLALTMSATIARGADTPTKVLGGLVNPESVCYGPHGLLYVTEIGQDGKDGDGKVTAIKDGEAQPFAKGLDYPKGIVFYKDALYVADKTRVIKVDAKGETSVYAAAEEFPTKPLFLNDIAVEPGSGVFLVSDSGTLTGKSGAVYRIDIRSKKIETVANAETIPALHTPNGVTFDGEQHFLLADFGSGA